MKLRSLICLSVCLVFGSCNENNSEVNNNNNSNAANVNPAQDQNPQVETSKEQSAASQPSQPDKTTGRSRTDAEIMLEGAQFLLGKAESMVRKQQIRDSINEINREKYFAYQVGIKMDRNEAYDMYKKLSGTGINSVYVFRESRKSYYIVQFQAKTEEELKQSLEAFKTELGEYATEGVKIINLTKEFCKKRESVTKTKKQDEDVEIPCLICD